MSRPRALLILAAVGLALYGSSLRTPFHYDDHHSVVRNPGIRNLGNLPRYFADPSYFSESRDWAMYRPLLLCTYALNYAVGGLEAPGYHLVNVVIHVGVAFALYDLGLGLVGGATAMGAALLYLVHPVAAETGLYVSARSDGLSLLLWLPAVTALLRGRRWLSAGFYGAALLTKSSAIVAPAVAWCLGRAFGGRSRRLAVRDMVPHAILAAAYLLGTRALVTRALGSGRVRGYAEQVLTQLEAWVYTARLLVVDHPLSVEHPIDTSAGLSPVHLAAAAAMGSLAWLALRSGAALRGGASPSLGLVSAFLPLVPASVVPLNAVVSEHRLSGVVAIGCLVGLGHLVRAPGRVRAALAAVGVVLAAATWTRSAVWASEVALWQSAARVAPTSGRVQFFLGDAYRRAGDDRAALAALCRADSLAGDDPNVRLSLAGQLLAMGRAREAAALLEPLVRAHPADPGGLYNLGLAVKAESPARAESLFAAAWKLRPELRRAAMELALLQDERGDPVAARASLEIALEDSATWPEAWVNLGFVCIRSGDTQCARTSWRRALELDPNLRVARENLLRLEEISGPAGGGRAEVR